MSKYLRYKKEDAEESASSCVFYSFSITARILATVLS